MFSCKCTCETLKISILQIFLSYVIRFSSQSGVLRLQPSDYVTGTALEESGVRWHQPMLGQRVLALRMFFR